MGKKSAIELIDRVSGEIVQETVFGDAALRFVYNTLLGRGLWGMLFNTSRLSELMGGKYDSPKSKKDIIKLASTPGCDPDEAEFAVDDYPTFNAFFTRKLKEGARPFDSAPDVMTSPADGRLFVYEDLNANDPIPVKGAQRTLKELCCGKLSFEKAAVAVIRLAPIDYHRYHFPCACVQQEEPFVFAGKYHSVNPVALIKRPDIYVENTRQITCLQSAEFGEFLYLEVGAFGVGSIVQTSNIGEHAKQDEKGYFKFGGSTVILVFDNSKLKWDADLLDNTRNGYETLIKCGSSIGKCR